MVPGGIPVWCIVDISLRPSGGGAFSVRTIVIHVAQNGRSINPVGAVCRRAYRSKHKSRRRGFQPRYPTRARFANEPTGQRTNPVGAVFNRAIPHAPGLPTRLPVKVYFLNLHATLENPPFSAVRREIRPPLPNSPENRYAILAHFSITSLRKCQIVPLLLLPKCHHFCEDCDFAGFRELAQILLYT